jgi:hypothetical protein
MKIIYETKKIKKIEGKTKDQQEVSTETFDIDDATVDKLVKLLKSAMDKFDVVGVFKQAIYKSDVAGILKNLIDKVDLKTLLSVIKEIKE